jgi:EmrB/QacA subfamily drug resistance transporter
MKERGTSIPISPSNVERKKWRVFFLVAIAVFMSTLDSGIVNVALPVIMIDFKAPLALISWVLIGYLLAVTALLLSFGRLSDIKGRRWVYSRGFFMFTLGSFLCGMATGVLWLIAARICQAIGAAMLMACSPALVVDAFPAAERGRILGLVGMVVAAGLTCGPALGGLILILFSWRAIFYINIPIGILAMLLAIRIMKRDGETAKREPFDWWGALISALCFSVFTLTMTHMTEWGPLSMKSLSGMIISIIFAVLAYRIEGSVASPVFDIGLLRNRPFILANLSSMILFAALFLVMFLMPFYLVHPGGFSIDKAGYVMMIPFGYLFVFSPLSGHLSDRIGTRLLSIIGIMTLSGALVALSTLKPGASFASLFWRLSMVGIGTAIFISPNTSLAISSVTSDQRGIASGTIATARNLGMVIGVALGEIVFNTIFRKLNGGDSLSSYGPQLQFAFISAFRWALIAGSLVATWGVVVTLLPGAGDKT